MKTNSPISWLFAAAALILTTIGCATPASQTTADNASRATESRAMLLGVSPQGVQRLSPSRERISFIAVDGKSTRPWYSLRAFPTEVSIEPGRRQVGIRYEHVHGVADGTLWVDAKAGRTYRVKVMNPQKRAERVYFLIEDVTAQTLVGGKTPEDAAP